MVVPDGMPLVWLGRLRGHGLRRRVYGPELMSVLPRDVIASTRHYFYGGAPGVADALAAQMASASPGLIVAGTCSPPFRPLTSDEDAAIVAQINTSRADIVWVGLSTPKQERWMHAHRALLDVPVMVESGPLSIFIPVASNRRRSGCVNRPRMALPPGAGAASALASLCRARIAVRLRRVTRTRGPAQIQ